jgi:hypothetical protein
MGKVFPMSRKQEATKAVDEYAEANEESEVSDDLVFDDWDDDYNYAWQADEQADEDAYYREQHVKLCEKIRLREIEVTPDLIQSVTDPEWKRELIEAMCLSKVHQKEKAK